MVVTGRGRRSRRKGRIGVDAYVVILHEALSAEVHEGRLRDEIRFHIFDFRFLIFDLLDSLEVLDDLDVLDG